MAGTPSDELKAFRASYDKLLRSIQSPEIIAASLFARNIITMELKSQVVDVLGITPFLKTMKLLDAVYGKITEDPKNLDTFLAVLNEDPALTTVIKTVKGQCKSDGLVCLNSTRVVMGTCHLHAVHIIPFHTFGCYDFGIK